MRMADEAALAKEIEDQARIKRLAVRDGELRKLDIEKNAAKAIEAQEEVDRLQLLLEVAVEKGKQARKEVHEARKLRLEEAAAVLGLSQLGAMLQLEYQELCTARQRPRHAWPMARNQHPYVPKPDSWCAPRLELLPVSLQPAEKETIRVELEESLVNRAGILAGLRPGELSLDPLAVKEKALEAHGSPFFPHEPVILS